jgi:hypothetical protein
MLDILKFIKDAKNKRAICFGTGACGEKISEILPVEIAYFIDNDSQKWNTTFKEYPVNSPEVLKKEDKERIVIFICSMYVDEITLQLQSMGFEEKVHYLNAHDIYLSTRQQLIKLDFPVHPVPRYGYGKPPHKMLYDIINSKRGKYESILQDIIKHKDYIVKIPLQASKTDSIFPHWLNGAMPGLDAVTIYHMIAENKPQRWFEVGSGNSTKFAKYAINTQKLSTELVVVDPYASSAMEAICDTLDRQPLEESDTSLFQQLTANDILFIDNSHRCFSNSDVTTVFMDIIPYLKSGVVVGIHDIFLPYDYPPEWNDWYYSEQYVLAAYLLAKGNGLEIILPNAFISHDEKLLECVAPLWDGWTTEKIEKSGGIFWFVIK